MNKKISINFLNLIVIIIFLLLPFLVFAQDPLNPDEGNNPLNKLKEIGADSGPYNESTDENTFFTGIGGIINIVFAFLSSVFLILTIYAGFRWMTASGNEEAVTKSRGTIKQAIIGLLIVLGSWGIWEIINKYWLSNLKI
jgi:hypothetical protein